MASDGEDGVCRPVHQLDCRADIHVNVATDCRPVARWKHAYWKRRFRETATEMAVLARNWRASRYRLADTVWLAVRRPHRSVRPRANASGMLAWS